MIFFKEWKTLMHLARMIPQVCHNVNRVVYIFKRDENEKRISGPIENITPTLCTPDVIHTLREADAIVNELLVKHELTKVKE